MTPQWEPEGSRHEIQGRDRALQKHQHLKARPQMQRDLEKAGKKLASERSDKENPRGLEEEDYRRGLECGSIFAAVNIIFVVNQNSRYGLTYSKVEQCEISCNLPDYCPKPKLFPGEITECKRYRENRVNDVGCEGEVSGSESGSKAFCATHKLR